LHEKTTPPISFVFSNDLRRHASKDFMACRPFIDE
jgi:hypothetical protein